MYASSSQLAQSRPAGTSAVSILAPAMRTEVTKIVICNTSGSSAKFSVYHDDNGTTYDQTTALYYGVALTGTAVIEAQFPGGGFTVASGGNLAVQTDTGSALTFTVYGAPETR